MKTIKEQLQDKLFRRDSKYTHIYYDLNDYIALSTMPSNEFNETRSKMGNNGASIEELTKHYWDNIKVIACPKINDLHPDAVVINEYYIQWFRELCLFLNNDFTPDGLGYILDTIDFLKNNIDKLH